MEYQRIHFASPVEIQRTLEHHDFLLSQTELPTALGNKQLSLSTAKTYIRQCLLDSNNTLTQSQLDHIAQQIITVIPTIKNIFNIQNSVQRQRSNGIQQQQSDRERWSSALAAKL
jgi:hypothetical protein